MPRIRKLQSSCLGLPTAAAGDSVSLLLIFRSYVVNYIYFFVWVDVSPPWTPAGLGDSSAPLSLCPSSGVGDQTPVVRLGHKRLLQLRHLGPQFPLSSEVLECGGIE